MGETSKTNRVFFLISKYRMSRSIQDLSVQNPSEMRRLCREWLRNKEVNPSTGKKISRTAKKGLYHDYERICRELGVRRSGHSGDDVAGPSRPVETSGPAKRKISASTNSDSSETKLAKALSMMELHENMDSNDRWIFKKCGNDDPISLMPFESDDYKDLITVRVPNRTGKFVKKGACIRRADILQYLLSDNVHFDFADPTRLDIPQTVLAFWDGYPMDQRGMGGHAKKKLFIKLPPNNIMITYKSFMRIMREGNVHEWFAVPMYNGAEIRLGNILSLFAVSSTHGQLPGSVIYKLYTREEIEKPNFAIKETKDEFYYSKNEWVEYLPRDKASDILAMLKKVAKQRYDNSIKS